MKPARVDDFGDYEPAPQKPKWVSTGDAWTILGCTPLLERKVAETLNENGLRVYVPIETYLPRTANVARSSKPWRPRTRPLIPGYLFAEILDDKGLDLARANQAVRLICNQGRPITVPAMEVGTLIVMEACGIFDHTKRPSGARKGRRRGKRGSGGVESRWKKGQRVKVGAGPFAGFLAEVVRATREDRIEVEISIFGRMTPTTLDEDEIEGEDEA